MIFPRAVPCGIKKECGVLRAKTGGTRRGPSQLERRRWNWRLSNGVAAAKSPRHNVDNPVVHTLMRGHPSFAILCVLELLPRGCPGGNLLYRTGRHANKTCSFAASRPHELAAASQGNGGRRCQTRIDNHRRSLQTLQFVHRTIPLLAPALCATAARGRWISELDATTRRKAGCCGAAPDRATVR